MRRLEEGDKLFHDILYTIWLVLVYYQKLFGYDAGESARCLSCQLVYGKSLDRMRVKVPKILDFKNPYCANEMKEIFNEYLAMVLPALKTVPPYPAGNGKAVESLYVTQVSADSICYEIDFLFINNSDAYNAVYKNNSNKQN